MPRMNAEHERCHVARAGGLEPPALLLIGSAGHGVEDHCASERASFSGMPEQRAKKPLI